MEEVSKKFFDKFSSELKASKIRYLFTVTSSTISIKSKLGDYFYTRSTIPFNQLQFINKVKQHVTSKKLNIKKYNKNHITYHSYSWLKAGTLKDVYEVDINSAYWDAAKKLGIISLPIYKEGMKMDKVTRLASLGSLAKNPTSIKFDGAKELFERDKPSSTSYIWYAVCKDVSDAIVEARNFIIEDFLFFWVDAIFFKGKKNIDIVKKILYSHSYESKVRIIHKIVVEDNKLHIYDNHKIYRPFPLIEI